MVTQCGGLAREPGTTQVLDTHPQIVSYDRSKTLSAVVAVNMLGSLFLVSNTCSESSRWEKELKDCPTSTARYCSSTTTGFIHRQTRLTSEIQWLRLLSRRQQTHKHADNHQWLILGKVPRYQTRKEGTVDNVEVCYRRTCLCKPWRGGSYCTGVHTTWQFV